MQLVTEKSGIRLVLYLKCNFAIFDKTIFLKYHRFLEISDEFSYSPTRPHMAYLSYTCPT